MTIIFGGYWCASSAVLLSDLRAADWCLRHFTLKIKGYEMTRIELEKKAEHMCALPQFMGNEGKKRLKETRFSDKTLEAIRQQAVIMKLGYNVRNTVIKF